MSLGGDHQGHLPLNNEEETVEEWKPFPGYEATHSISSLGRVKSVPRLANRSDGKRQTVRGRVLPLQTNRLGYVGLVMQDHKYVRVHRAVCEAFHGPAPEGKPLALHGNGVRDDNRAENLRWGNQSDNIKESVSQGTHVNSRKTQCKYGHDLTEENIYRRPSSPEKRECRICRQEYRAGKRTRKENK